MRWLVERKQDDFEDVGAARLEVRDGCLVFTDESGAVRVVYAPGQWIIVTEAAE